MSIHIIVLTVIEHIHIAVDFLIAIRYNMTIKSNQSQRSYEVCIKRLAYLQIMFR